MSTWHAGHKRRNVFVTTRHHATIHPPILQRLRDTGMTFADPLHDICGLEVVNHEGDPLGTVDDFFVDLPHRKLRLIRVVSGGVLGFGQTRVLIPVEAITRLTPHRVTVHATPARNAGPPRYDPQLVEATDRMGAHQYYGYAPFWIAGFIPPLPPPPPGETRH
jgi:hypothetical protein